MLGSRSPEREARAGTNGPSAFGRTDWSRGRSALANFSRMQSHPLTRAIADNKLPVARRDWTEGRRALQLFSTILSGAMMRAIRGKLLYFEGPSDWTRSRGAMASVFGFDLPHHLFRANPVTWVMMTEPQATKAFAQFLGAGDRTLRSKRIQAFLRALGHSGGEGSEDLRAPRATPEASTKSQQRIDLLLEWQDADDLHRGAAIEAKFGHHILSKTLPRYREHLLQIEESYRDKPGRREERPLLFVVSSRLRQHDEKALRKNRDWRWTSWRSLLLAFDRALDEQHDDDDFRQFRRTLWDRGGP